MKNVMTYSTGGEREVMKSWLFGIVCGAVLAISAVAGSGHLELHHPASIAPVTAPQQPAASSNRQSVPTPIDEYQQYQRTQTTQRTTAESNEGLVPPSVDEIHMYESAPGMIGPGEGEPMPPMPGKNIY